MAKGTVMNEERQAMRMHTAEYIEEMAGHLRAMSATARLDFLTYLLEMVMTEASCARQGNVSAGPGCAHHALRPLHATPEEMAQRYMSHDNDSGTPS